MARLAGVAAFVLCAALVAGCGGGGGVHAVSGAACDPVFYEGPGHPDALIVSDLPRKGKLFRDVTTTMVESIEVVLRGRGFRAGGLRVGYQSCDDAVGDIFDEATCAADAKSYVADADVLGVVGTYNSGCAVPMLPVLSRRSAGPLAMVSPANTYVGLTRPGPGVCCGHPGTLYPDGVRSYVRLVAPDDVQGAAAAVAARRLGARSAVVVELRAPDYSLSLAAAFARAGRAQGMSVTRLQYTPQSDVAAIARAAASRRPDAVYVATLPQANGRALLQALRAAIGPRVPLIASDAFLGLGRELGAVGESLYVTEPGVPADRLTPAGERFVRALGKPRASLRATWALETAAATDVLLAAIARSDGSRASVVRELFATRASGSVIGSFRFDAHGDVEPAVYGLYRYAGTRELPVGSVRVPGHLSR